MRDKKEGGGDRVVDWIWRLCNMAFESGIVLENCKSGLIFPLYKGKGKRMNSGVIEVLDY